MDTKGNPRKSIARNVFYAVFALLGSLSIYLAYTNLTELQHTVEVQEKTIAEQGSLLDLRIKEIGSLKDERLQLNQTLERQQVEFEETIEKKDGQIKKKDKKINSLEEEIESLKKELQSKKADEARQAVVASSSSLPSRGSGGPSFKEMTMTATAYTAYCKGCSGTTATGINLRENPSLKVIAVDPSVIPLGTKVFVEGYGYAVAGDTGGAIKGSKIDIFIPNKSDAYEWGVKTVKVRVYN